MSFFLLKIIGYYNLSKEYCVIKKKTQLNLLIIILQMNDDHKSLIVYHASIGYY